MGWDGAVLIYLFQFSSSGPLLAEIRIFLLLRPGEPSLPTPGRPDPGTLNWLMLLRIACKRAVALVKLPLFEPGALRALLCHGHGVAFAERACCCPSEDR